jgi:hypothetical protein
MGGSSGGGGVVPFNMSALAPFMPSVFKGPYNAQGAKQNEDMIQQKYPWIAPPAGQFEGAQPGQFAGAGGGAGFPTPPNPNPAIPPTVPPSSQFNPNAIAGGQTNPMQPNSLQAILAVLGGGASPPTSAVPAAPGGQ